MGSQTKNIRYDYNSTFAYLSRNHESPSLLAFRLLNKLLQNVILSVPLIFFSPHSLTQQYKRALNYVACKGKSIKMEENRK